MPVQRSNIQALLLKRQQPNEGFTLVEVLVGILLVLIFAAVSMQAFVAATALKVRAQEISEADKWINADLESLKVRATQLDLGGTEYNPFLLACLGDSADDGGSNSTEGYGARLNNDIVTNAPLSGGNANSMTMNSEIGSRPYTLARAFTNVNTSPYNRLAVTYTVTDQADNSVVATFYSELLPDASLVCPAQPS
ncbi:hypothetical protein C1752_02699 [Acaryochloris thomasi RCC1774]|uniref:Prepilin-type N-terminal cleavage/methylation domain-containing protein n=1 Tax=Acaryochloris thomasi RCC1774 TaxID=1764569 RepID=A0A2W1JHP0_9CYAN|nr:type II secretion system protein [Acaryochloris thomasi]PZD73069.1 hypothetical protein C1752_02699 [Acaryochloris thomasi RCC1774]